VASEEVKDLHWMATIWKLNIFCQYLNFAQTEDILIEICTGKGEGIFID